MCISKSPYAIYTYFIYLFISVLLLDSRAFRHFSIYIMSILCAAGNTFVGNTSLFDCKDNGDKLVAIWEAEYNRVMAEKYKKNIRNFSRLIERPRSTYSTPYGPPIFLVPRERGGPSYKSVPLVCKGTRVDPAHVAYCPISKGFPMQDVSSFTLGPVVGRGLCVVNAAFSASVCCFHLQGGNMDLSRKGYWRKLRKPTHTVQVVENYDGGATGRLRVDGVIYNTCEWLRTHENEWLPEWQKWQRAIGVASMGSFHWCGNDVTIAYRDVLATNENERYLDFVAWKKRCYIQPAYELLKGNRVYEYLDMLRKMNWTLGLVHPMAYGDHPEYPVTPKDIRELFDSRDEMSCLPHVLCGKLLGVPIYKDTK